MNKKKGILLLLTSSFCFAVMAASVKSVPHIPLYEKVFFRNLLGIFIMGGFIIKNKKSFKSSNAKLLAMRCIFGVLGVMAYFYSISKLALSDAVLLNKMSPFFVVIFSVLFLKEKINKFQVYAIIIALIGAGFVIKPQFNYTVIPAIIGLLSAILAASSYTIIRHLRLYDSPEVIVFYFSLFSSISMIPFMIAGNFTIPTYKDLLILLLISLSATCAQTFMTNAYRYAPASQLAIYGYANIIFSTIFGIILWNEFPDLLSITGGLLIILGGFINYISTNSKHFKTKK
ncbi:DMT family transporter [Caminicella sporogenes]|uniref:DMT family transporter n=1 Tax=Caminicella sporogenes TaxID=166485 RepID=UPI00254211FC|nr:DMT family transporter [Caminicella sporogenes]WIF95694.1 DMT family transporter [Caminicella sporogenes]